MTTTFFLPAVPEFEPVWTHCGRKPGVRVVPVHDAFIMVESQGDLVLHRKEIGIKAAVWFGLFTGGLDGYIKQFDADTVHLTGDPLEPQP